MEWLLKVAKFQLGEMVKVINPDCLYWQYYGEIGKVVDVGIPVLPMRAYARIRASEEDSKGPLYLVEFGGPGRSGLFCEKDLEKCIFWYPYYITAGKGEFLLPKDVSEIEMYEIKVFKKVRLLRKVSEEEQDVEGNEEAEEGV